MQNEIAQIITALAALVAAVGSAVSIMMSARNGWKIEEVHKATNSMKDALVSSTAKENFAAGLKQGQDDRTPRNGA